MRAFRHRLLIGTCYLLVMDEREMCVRLAGGRSENLHTHHSGPQPDGRPPVHPRPPIPVATVVGMVGEGMAEAEILSAYPDLEVEDVREALRYAAEAVRERELPVTGGS